MSWFTAPGTLTPDQAYKAIDIDTLTEKQRKYMASWSEGT